MRDYNKLTITGNVGRGREGAAGPVTVRHTQSGQSVVEFSIGSNRSVRDEREPSGWRDETEWLTVLVWGEAGERLAETLATGYRVLVEGRFQTRKWTDREGQLRLTVELVANDVLVMSSRADRDRITDRRNQPPVDIGPETAVEDDNPFV